ncbi:MAG: hypothetical protein ACI92S_003767 [Planctomycetaceae bacterium]
MTAAGKRTEMQSKAVRDGKPDGKTPPSNSESSASPGIELVH